MSIVISAPQVLHTAISCLGAVGCGVGSAVGSGVGAGVGCGVDAGSGSGFDSEVGSFSGTAADWEVDCDSYKE